jgi:protein-tyrosine phosphatase
MVINLYWITNPTPGRLATMARPRGNDWLEDEMQFLAANDVDVLVSLLTTAEVIELGLEDEEHYCTQQQMQFMSFPIPDLQTPVLNRATFEWLQQIAQLIQQGKTVVVHCRMGIGRSSLVAAAVLTLCGVASDHAFDAIAQARGRPVPDTPEQRAWVAQFAQASKEPGFNDVSSVWRL